MRKALSLFLILCMLIGFANFSVIAETVNFVPAADSTFGSGSFTWTALAGGILKETDNPIGPGKVLCYSDLPDASYASPQIDVRNYVQNNVKQATTLYASMDIFSENNNISNLIIRIRTKTASGYSKCKEAGTAYCTLGTANIIAGQWNRITVSFNVTESDLESTEPWNLCFDGLTSKTREPIYIDNFYIGLDEENPLDMPTISDGEVENFLLPADSTFESGTTSWKRLSAGTVAVVDNPLGSGQALCYSDLDPSKGYASPQLDIRSAIQGNVDKATTIYGAMDIYCEKDIINAIVRLRTTTASGFSMCEAAGTPYCTIDTIDTLAGEWTRVIFSFEITEKDLSSTEPWNLCFDGIAKNLTTEDKIYIDNAYIGVDKPENIIVENKPIPEKTVVSRLDNTLVGTVRWDAFTESTPGGTDVASQVARVLSPTKYHSQAPFFSVVNDDNTIAFPEYTVKTWEKEAEYAVNGGLDYFAYLWYETNDAMSQPRKMHLQSEKKDIIKFCGVLGHIYSKKSMNELWEAMKDSCYLTLDGRPLLFLYGASGSNWTKANVDQLRQDAANAGIEKSLYIIGMCDNANQTTFTEVVAKGVDGVSWYGESAWSTAETYASLKARCESRIRTMSEYAQTYGVDIIPSFTTGFDTRARIQTGVTWVDGDPNATNDADKPYKNWYSLQPTMEELENHIEYVLEYTNTSSAAKTNIVCSYAWNEHEEGGWLCPTITVDENGDPVYNSDGTIKANTERLDTLKSAKESIFGITSAPESKLCGATILTTERNYRTSSPSQNITDKIKAKGLGTYYYYGYVRLTKTPDKPVTISLGLECKYTKSDGSAGTAWPATGHKSTQAISDNEWHLIGGKLTLAESTYGTADSITNAITFAETLYQGTSGDAGAYKGDIEWDGFVLYKDTNGSYSDNLFVNSDMNIDLTGATSGWGKNQGFTMANSLVIPQNDENALHAEDRSTNTSGPSQTLTGRLEKGTYLYSGYVRLTEAPENAKGVSLGIELTNGGAGVAWPAVSTQISDTEWHKISGTVTISKDFDKAVTFVNTSEASGQGADIELDGLFLAKQDENGLYGENIILNPTMEYDETGSTPEWGLYRLATVTNTGFKTEEPEVPSTPIENPDGSVTYPDGTVPVTDKNILYSGRFYDVDGGKQTAFESYVEIKFTGNQISTMSGSKGNVYYELDGVINYDVISLANLKLTNLNSGTHTLRIYANAQASRFILSGVVIDKNEKTLPITQVKKIEFIGDSITEGYVDPSDKAENIANNSYLNSYALKAGRMLNEEFGWSFNTVAFGGIGLVRVNNGDPVTMGERYFTQREYIKSTDGTTRETALAAAGTYDKNYVPDYIVINLGTNDGSLSSQTYFENYVDFIKDLKEAYPNVVIFCMTPFNGAKEYYIKMVAEEFSQDVYVIDSAQWGIKEGKDVHPAPASLDEAAEKLFAVLSEYNEKGSLPKIKALNAKQLSITSDMQYAFAYFRATDLGLSADMADENGYITRSYTIQNVGEYDAKMRVLWQHDWTDIKNSSAVSKTVKVGESQEFTIKLQIDENGQVEDTNGIKADLNAVTFRVEFTNSSTSGSIVYAGTSCIIKPNDPYDFTIAEINQGSVYKNNNVAEAKGACAYKGVNAESEKKIVGASVDIGASLTINYYANVETDENVMMRFTSSSGRITEVNGVLDENTGYYKFAYTGINPQCMSDNIKAELICGENVYDTKENYSVKDYCENQVNRSAESLGLTKAEFRYLKTLLADMLVYGSASQEYKDYNTTNLADSAEWVEENKSTFTVPTGVRKITGNSDANNKATAVGLHMANVNKIYFKFKLTEDVVVKLNGKEVNKSTLVDNGDGTYTLYSDGIKATQFDDVFTLTITKDGKEITKVEYNVNAYIQAKYNLSGIEKIVKALSNYGVSAKVYQGEFRDNSFELEEDNL